jgi:hypothetical protein
VANLEYVVAGYLFTAAALVAYVVRLHLRARGANRRVRAIVEKRAS